MNYEEKEIGVRVTNFFANGSLLNISEARRNYVNYATWLTLQPMQVYVMYMYV